MSISERVYIAWVRVPLPDLYAHTPSHLPSSLQIPPQSRPPPSSSPRTTSSSLTSDSSPLSPHCSSPSLDWGTGGRSIGTADHGIWTHDIDSRTAHPHDDAPDEGDNAPHPTLPGVILEKGRMLHPASGEVRAYEEAWRSSTVVLGQGWTARIGRGGAKGMVVRVGQSCQGIVRIGDVVCAERWAWSEEHAWTRTVRVGSFAFPCDSTWSDGLREGDVIVRNGVSWRCRP
ncbi:uncharacterized protein BXZ73DRAFT_91102 [Epithele typhae]|uniref:uncharacterized protein n=1 Tax=Epithele typhae TaxID=378194 RepID=UPI002008383F|nr:uncharacterized protein BXZ73DRAFT_91102 [Epithele typhae]KAH9925364.1 hypothetical protein BXZ73DRAFT_91102 [Epithele typhae]